MKQFINHKPVKKILLKHYIIEGITECKNLKIIIMNKICIFTCSQGVMLMVTSHVFETNNSISVSPHTLEWKCIMCYNLGFISAFVFLPSKAPSQAIAVSPSAMYNMYYSHEVPKLLCANATNRKKELLVLLRLPTARRIPELRTPAGTTAAKRLPSLLYFTSTGLL